MLKWHTDSKWVSYQPDLEISLRDLNAYNFWFPAMFLHRQSLKLCILALLVFIKRNKWLCIKASAK